MGRPGDLSLTHDLMRLFRPFSFLLALALTAGCSTLTGPDPKGQLLLVDSAGMPVAGVAVVPGQESDNAPAPNYAQLALEKHTSDAQGRLQVDLDEFVWSSDGNYHFLIHRAGYEDFTMTASKDLFPPLLRIELKARAAPAPSGTRSP